MLTLQESEVTGRGASLDLHSRGPYHTNEELYYVVAVPGQEIQLDKT